MWPMTKRNHLPLVLAATLSIAVIATAQNPAQNSAQNSARNSTAPPPTQHPILTVTGKGSQIYACQQLPTGPQWVFQAPEATLTDAYGNNVGTHGAGPIWKSKDGSEVKGELLQIGPPTEPNAIPWLLLKAASASGSGIMTKVEFIRRSDTHGGATPTVGCDAQHLNTILRVPYTATYTFYSAKP
jgi:hypothetical protein